jgi:predicted Rossmann fold nucleotide-binding protein DprA/Smf involved in DNA uptake
MKLAIVGSRDFKDYGLLCREVYKNFDISNITEIVSGGARGADTLGQKFAEEHNLPIKIFYPDWNLHGRAAGMIRNEYIVDAADAVLAMWDGQSPGTRGCLKYAEKRNKPIFVVKFEFTPKAPMVDPFKDL